MVYAIRFIVVSSSGVVVVRVSMMAWIIWRTGLIDRVVTVATGFREAADVIVVMRQWLPLMNGKGSLSAIGFLPVMFLGRTVVLLLTSGDVRSMPLQFLMIRMTARLLGAVFVAVDAVLILLDLTRVVTLRVCRWIDRLTEPASEIRSIVTRLTVLMTRVVLIIIMVITADWVWMLWCVY